MGIDKWVNISSIRGMDRDGYIGSVIGTSRGLRRQYYGPGYRGPYIWA
jgi:hypothetical protein